MKSHTPAVASLSLPLNRATATRAKGNPRLQMTPNTLRRASHMALIPDSHFFCGSKGSYGSLCRKNTAGSVLHLTDSAGLTPARNYVFLGVWHEAFPMG